ncbi:hypothetical protein B0H19DRAFT_1062410 [Mycena capillaripes]|nr:hypothetical protein B0H19DRAFT_1062410 [Mycena capillaripes]
MYRKDLDPEISTWDEVIRAAEHAEIVQNIESESSTSSAEEDTPETQNHRSRHRGDHAGGRIDSKHPSKVMRVSSAEVTTSDPGEKRRSAKRRNEMLTQGFCFTCEQPGHLARNCPTTTNIKSDVKGRPPEFGAHSVHLNATDAALFETTEVLDTLPIGAIGFGDGASVAVGIPMELNTQDDTSVENENPNDGRFPRFVSSLRALMPGHERFEDRPKSRSGGRM